MLKHSLLAIVSLATISFAPLPVSTGPAMAAIIDGQCTANCTPPGGGESTFSCTDEMGFLRRVHEEQLDGIDNPLNVSVTPICVGVSYGVMHSDGNAGALRQSIASNGAIMQALKGKRFLSDDVVGIRMTGEDKVILYVHQFHHR
ncbi:MAG TPA: hypothetical protein PK286_12570 [Devosia sp.]|nr:hypothetical protein [Devosia sp.]